MASPEQLRTLAKEATCPICLGYSAEPVSVQCGHTFCTPCITRYWEGVQGPYPCPQCRETEPTPFLEAAHECKENFKIQRERITNVFDQVQQFLKKEKYRHLSNLEEEEKRTVQEIRGTERRLDDGQTMDRNKIRDVESKCQQLDVERQLKDVESILSRVEKMKCQYPEKRKDKVKKTEENEVVVEEEKEVAEEEKDVADVEEEDEDENEEQHDVEKE